VNQVVQVAGSVETCAHVMTHAGLEKIRSHLSAVEALLARSRGGSEDDDTLLEFRRLCWAALLLTDDLECQEQIDLLVQHAKALYSGRDDADSLKGKVQAALGAFRQRLNNLEGGYGKRWRDLRAA
jgi:hypothetical protein